ncbi:MAG: metallophosphatase family protein [Spirochaetes bacterium]|nr:metallophosphatase family protein [Spirochaetota bacterium]
MRILILADIHSNLEALKKVLFYIEQKKIAIDKYYVLGDIVGYGPFPNECVQLIRELPDHKSIPGNHEWAVTGKVDTQYFNAHAREAIAWTRKILKNDHYIYLDGLPLTEKLQSDGLKYLFLHGSPENKIEEYIFNTYMAKRNFNCFKENICFFGHTHMPILFLKMEHKIEAIPLNDGDVVELKDEYRYLINVGSVGQPRDGDPRASFGILDTERRTVLIKRLDYNIKKTQKHIIDFKLPRGLATRLSDGR